MYIGRFAPSPTGLLHLGSLFAAVASWLDARANGGQWLLRIDDIDPPREQPGAVASIISMLAQYGMTPDGPIVYQSEREEAYQAALHTLQQSGKLFWCTCSRKDLKGTSHYPGTCFAFTKARPNAAAKWRTTASIEFEDQLQGHQSQPELEPFVVHRRDQLWAYQLAVVVDDYLAGITHIVRGIDLMSSTPMQISLQQALAYPTPNYAHLPVIVNPDGSKLSKQNLAQPIEAHNKETQLRDVLVRLGIEPEGSCVRSLLNNAIGQWKLTRLRDHKTQEL